MKHIIGFSGGKDSTASTILAHIMKRPVSELVYCRVMFDEETSAEVPEHERFLREVAFPKIQKDFGFKIVTVIFARIMDCFPQFTILHQETAASSALMQKKRNSGTCEIITGTCGIGCLNWNGCQESSKRTTTGK